MEQKRILHMGFEISLVLKGLNGILEALASALFLFLNPGRMNGLLQFLTRQERLEDPQDRIANLILQIGSGFSVSTQHFAVFYLLSHGLVKVVLVLLLWRRKLWAYPLTIAVLLLFIAYQVYRYTFHPSVFLIGLTLFDLLMIVLTHVEYQRLRTEK